MQGRLRRQSGLVVRASVTSAMEPREHSEADDRHRHKHHISLGRVNHLVGESPRVAFSHDIRLGSITTPQPEWISLPPPSRHSAYVTVRYATMPHRPHLM